MTAKKKQKKRQKPTPPYWTRTGQRAFEEFQASLSPERIAEDKETLSEVFKLAMDSPQLAEELAWARARGIQFFVDRNVEKMAAYYKFGAGALGIAVGTLKNPEDAVEAIAHELRHAWQDDKQMAGNNYTDDYVDYFIPQALIEADAHAFGQLARTQYKEMQLLKSGVDINPFRSKHEENALLGQAFMDWFRPDLGKTRAYGEGSSKFFAKTKGLLKTVAGPAGALPGSNTIEFKTCPPVAPTQLSIAVQDVLPLGENFSRTGNYLTQLPRDFLIKEILSPSLANSFWGAAKPEQISLLSEMRKVDIRQKLAQPKTIKFKG